MADEYQRAGELWNDVADESALKATASKAKKAGGYLRKTITLPPEQIALVSELAGENGVGILAFYRWLIDQGLLAYDEGERPTKKKPVHEIETSHPSSEVGGD